jgi:uncharacterized membrane protein YfcA
MSDMSSMLASISNVLPVLAAGPVIGLLATLFIAGMARGFSGFGAALIFIPLGSAIVGPNIASPLLLVIDMVVAASMLPDALRKADKKEVGIMAIGAALTVPVGTVALVAVDGVVVRWAISVTAILFLAFLISGWRYQGRPSALAAVGVGAMAGLFSGAAQLGGPPVVAYWLGGKADIATVRANIVVYFALSSVLTAVSYVFAALLSGQIFLLALIGAPFYALGLFAGARCFGLASDRTFRRASYVLIGLAAVTSLPLLDGIIS